MIAYLTVVQTELNLVFIGVGVLALLVWTYFDTNYIYPREAIAVIDLNPMWHKLYERLDDIEGKVDRIHICGDCAEKLRSGEITVHGGFAMEGEHE